MSLMRSQYLYEVNICKTQGISPISVGYIYIYMIIYSGNVSYELFCVWIMGTFY